MKMTKNYRNNPNKSETITLNYLSSSNGLVLEAVPKTNIQELKKDQTTGLAGVVYYKNATTSASLDGKMTLTPGEGKITVAWNTGTETLADKDVKNMKENVGEKFFTFAKNGTYKVTLYTAKEDGAKLSSMTYT